jgi:hypothetical protein
MSHELVVAHLLALHKSPRREVQGVQGFAQTFLRLRSLSRNLSALKGLVQDVLGVQAFAQTFSQGTQVASWIFQGGWWPAMFSMFRLLPKLLACTKTTRGIFINVSFLQRVDLES